MPRRCQQQPGAVVDLVLRTLTRMGLVNFGSYRQLHFSQTVSAGTRQPLRVIVIGAGMAGLGAARHLQQQGALVTVLEAKAGGMWPNLYRLRRCIGRNYVLNAFCPLKTIFPNTFSAPGPGGRPDSFATLARPHSRHGGHGAHWTWSEGGG